MKELLERWQVDAREAIAKSHDDGPHVVKGERAAWAGHANGHYKCISELKAIIKPYQRAQRSMAVDE